MNLTKALLSILFTFGFCTISAQSISGVVADAQTKKPLEGVHIYLKDNATGTVSDANGKWLLNLAQTDSLFFSFVGYQTVKLELKSFLNLKRDTIFLNPKEERLDEVAVSGRRKMKDKIVAEKLASMPYALTGFGSAVVNGKIYVFGGDQSLKTDDFRKGFQQLSDIDPSQQFDPMLFTKLALAQSTSWNSYSDKLQVYDLVEDSWTKSDTKFSKRAYHTVVPSNRKIYVMGGKTISTNGAFEYLANTIEVYDIARDTVLVDYVNPHEAANPLGVAYGDDILLLGGSTKMTPNGSKKYTDKIHFYNVPSGKWYELNPIPKRMETDGAIVNGKIYLSVDKMLCQMDLKSGKWEKLDNLELSFQNAKFTNGDGILYIYQKEMLFSFNPKYGELKKYFINVNVENPNIHFYNNQLFILGGTHSREFSSKPSNEVFRVNLNDLKFTKPVSIISI